jgi:poly(3-hydroxybutyrate) depolymerase
VKLPSDYDENTPYRVMFMFNPTGNPINWAEQNAGYEKAAPDAIRVYPHMGNQSNGWQPNETSFFQDLYDSITGNFCVDKARVFAGGESSGGEFSAFLGCEYGDLLRGIAPGAPKETSWAIDPTKHECKGNPAAIVIWSPADSVLQQPAGGKFRDFYHDVNACGDTSGPVDGYTDELSNCEEYEGCKAGSPVYFCQHNDPNYGGTHHGWAGFAAKMTWEVFSAF